MCPTGYKYDGVSLCWEECKKKDVPNNIPEDEVDIGAICQSCPDGMKNNGASLCYEPCDTGYTVALGVCYSNKDSVAPGKAPTICNEGYNLYGGRCYKKTCIDGYVYDNTTNCNRNDTLIATGVHQKEECPTGYKLFFGRCYKDSCDDKYDFDNMKTCNAKGVKLDAGIDPTYTCPTGYYLTGLTCQVRTKAATADCSPCDSLTKVTNHPLTCTGTKTEERCLAGVGGLCGTKNECVGDDCMPGWGGDCGQTCTDVAKWCTWTNYSWGAGSRCGE